MKPRIILNYISCRIYGKTVELYIKRQFNVIIISSKLYNVNLIFARFLLILLKCKKTAHYFLRFEQKKIMGSEYAYDCMLHYSEIFFATGSLTQTRVPLPSSLSRVTVPP